MKASTIIFPYIVGLLRILLCLLVRLLSPKPAVGLMLFGFMEHLQVRPVKKRVEDGVKRREADEQAKNMVAARTELRDMSHDIAEYVRRQGDWRKYWRLKEDKAISDILENVAVCFMTFTNRLLRNFARLDRHRCEKAARHRDRHIDRKNPLPAWIRSETENGAKIVSCCDDNLA